MGEVAKGGLFDLVTKSGVKVALAPSETPQTTYHAFFPDQTQRAKEDNVYLNTRGWTFMGEHFDDAGKVIPFHPDDLPEGLEYAPIGFQRIDEEILHRYVVFNSETADIKVIRGGKDLRDGLSSKDIDLDALEDKGYKQLFSDLGIQIYAKTKIHAVELPADILKDEELRKIVVEEMQFVEPKRK